MAENNAIGWIGLGKMGVPMAGHLLSAGFALTVNSRSPGPVAALCDAGAKAAASPAALAEKAGVIISMTSDDTALADVSTGPNGVFTTAAPGTLFIDMSTVSPDISARVAARARECGIGFLRAPVSGGVALAVAGTLTVFASGARADFEAALPLFDAMAKKSFFVGEAEEARYIKLALNMMVGMTSAMMAEALVFAERGARHHPRCDGRKRHRLAAGRLQARADAQARFFSHLQRPPDGQGFRPPARRGARHRHAAAARRPGPPDVVLDDRQRLWRRGFPRLCENHGNAQRHAVRVKVLYLFS